MAVTSSRYTIPGQATIFGSSGFAAPYYEVPDGGIRSNQVRHAVGGLIAGYVGIPLWRMNMRENDADLAHGVPDINLNNLTVPMGGLIMAGKKDINVGISAINELGNWIRENLCTH